VLWMATAAFEARAAEKDIVLNADRAPVGLTIDADESAFQSMIFQLVDNAVAFTQAGGRVELAAVQDAGTIRITVRDNGPGVAAADLERILRPFEQGGRGTADHTSGAGLGLTLVKAFSEAHGGSFAIESAPDKGFTAAIELPAAAA